MEDFWISKSEGVLRRDGDGFSNERFVANIAKDDSPLGRYMYAMFPTSTKIRTLHGDPSPRWTTWENVDINIQDVEDSLSFLTEPKGVERLYMTKGEMSKRIRHAMSQAHMDVTPRGIKSKGIPLDAGSTLQSVISTIYLLIEKNTTASLRNKTQSSLSQDKLLKLSTMYHTLSGRNNVLPLLLSNAYVEPSPTAIVRAYLLAEVHGMTTVNLLINDIYYRKCQQQVKEVESIYRLVSED